MDNENEPHLIEGLITQIDGDRTRMLNGEILKKDFAKNFFKNAGELIKIGAIADPDIRGYLQYFARVPEIYLPVINISDKLMQLLKGEAPYEYDGPKGEGTYALCESVNLILGIAASLGLNQDPHIGNFLNLIGQEVSQRLKDPELSKYRYVAQAETYPEKVGHLIESLITWVDGDPLAPRPQDPEPIPEPQTDLVFEIARSRELSPDEKWEEIKKELYEYSAQTIIADHEVDVSDLRRRAGIMDLEYKHRYDKLPDHDKPAIEHLKEELGRLAGQNPYVLGEVSSLFNNENRVYLDNLLRRLFHGKYDTDAFHEGQRAPKHYQDFLGLVFSRTPEVIPHVFEIDSKSYEALAKKHGVEALIGKVKQWAEQNESYKTPAEFTNSSSTDLNVFGKLGRGHTAEVFLGQVIPEPKLNGSPPANEYVAIKYAFANENRTLHEEEGRLKKLEQYQKENGLLVNSKPISPHAYYRVNGDRAQYMVMDLAQGIPMNEILKLKEYVLPEAEVVEMMRQFLIIIEAVHIGLDRTLEDLHPQEIFWDKDQMKLTVIDFNILGGDPLGGENHVNKYVSSDVYLASQLFFRLLTGNDFKIGEYPVKQLQNIKDPGVRTVLGRAFHPDGSKRFKSAKEFREAIQDVIKNYGK